MVCFVFSSEKIYFKFLLLGVKLIANDVSPALLLQLVLHFSTCIYLRRYLPIWYQYENCTSYFLMKYVQLPEILMFYSAIYVFCDNILHPEQETKSVMPGLLNHHPNECTCFYWYSFILITHSQPGALSLVLFHDFYLLYT